MRKKNKMLVSGIIMIILAIASCSKDSTPAPPSDPCSGKTIVISATTIPTTGGAGNGAISASATGSSGFTFNINGGAFQAGGNFTNLAVGSYTVGAKDAAGCLKTQSFAVTATPCPAIAVTATTTPATTPASADGTIAASATGSTGITYQLNSGAFQSSGTFSGLVAGTYTVTAKDLNGCTGSTVVVLASVGCPTITITATTTPASGPAATNGTLTATATGGTAPYTYSRNGGVTFQGSGAFTGLAPGNYTILAKDASNCTGTSSSITVTSSCPALTLSSSVLGSDKCIVNTGSITLTATGSTGFTYNLNGGAFQASNIFVSLATGNYTVGAKDVNGCTVSNTANVPVAPSGPQFLSVKGVLAASCALAGCHISPFPQNGLDFTDDCTIVSQSLRIKARAVDGNPSFMPPAPNPQLSASDKQKIVDWINGGGGNRN